MSNIADNKADAIGLGKLLAIATVLVVLAMPLILLWMKQGEDNRKHYVVPGLAAYDQGHYADAEKDLKQFLAIYPDNSATLYNLGLCTLAEGKKEEARSEFQASDANYGTKGGPHMCNDRPCGDLSKEMLAWMDQNPYWDASRATSIPPFPSAR